MANITTPLLGLVDTAILGHMGASHFLAGASIGSLIITQLYWICGFLKMSMTGISAQAYSESEKIKLQRLITGLYFALGASLIILLFQSLFIKAGLWFLSSSPQAVESANAYFNVRIWGAPAALINMLVIGWLIGQQKTVIVFVWQLVINILNILVSVVLVYGFDMGVAGVATGTLAAEYTGLVIGLTVCFFRIDILTLNWALPRVEAAKSFLSLNANILIRNLILQATLAFVSLVGATYGVQAAAINALMMQFFALIALGLDGIANAVEAMVGEAKGKKAHKELFGAVKVGVIWSTLFAVFYSLLFFFSKDTLVNLFTDQQDIISAFGGYLPILVLLPLISHTCFLFDGVYVGLTEARAMRNTMLISMVFGFLPVYYLTKNSYQNEALWFAMLSFLAWRGFSLCAHFYYKGPAIDSAYKRSQ